MNEQLKSRRNELQKKKKELQPKIDEINAKREDELQKVNKKYDHMIYDINYTAQQLEDEFYNDLIKSFVQIIIREFDLKRSSDLYEVSNKFKDYKESIGEFDMFPRELIDRMHRVIKGDPIEDIMYDLDKIQKKYLKS
jgi:seryl-tRNA synthetase